MVHAAGDGSAPFDRTLVGDENPCPFLEGSDGGVVACQASTDDENVCLQLFTKCSMLLAISVYSLIIMLDDLKSCKCTL